jgi:hypothetical protein
MIKVISRKPYEMSKSGFGRLPEMRLPNPGRQPANTRRGIGKHGQWNEGRCRFRVVARATQNNAAALERQRRQDPTPRYHTWLRMTGEALLNDPQFLCPKPTLAADDSTTAIRLLR